MATANRSAKLDLADYLPYLVNRVGSIVAEQFGEEALAPHGLSIAMWRVLAALASADRQAYFGSPEDHQRFFSEPPLLV